MSAMEKPGIFRRIGAALFGAAGYENTSAVIGGYTVGNPSPTSRGDGSKWRYGLSNSGSTPNLDHRLLRRNARSQYHETPAARSIIDRYKDTVAGRGLRLEATPDARLLGLTIEQARDWSIATEAAFDAWARNKKCHLQENMTFYQMHRLAFLSQYRDGEAFVRLTYSKSKNLLSFVRLSFIDPEQIGGGIAYTDTGSPIYSDSGITRDRDGKAIGYTVRVRGGDGTFKQVEIPARSSRTGLPNILHMFDPEYAGQDRGYSKISHIIQDLEKYTDFTSATIQKAIIEASIAVWVEPSEDAPASNPVVDQASGPRRPNDPRQAINSSSENDQIIDYSEINDVNLRPGSLSVFSLQAGEKLKPFEQKNPSEHYSAFQDAFIGNLASSVGMPPEMVKLKFGSSYSASRAILVIFWEVARIMQDDLASDFLNPVYEVWLTGEIAAGRIQCPGWSDPRMREAWLKANWIGMPMPSIDPNKAAKATELNLKMGLTTHAREAREKHGTDFDANTARLKVENEKLREANGAEPVAIPNPVDGNGENNG
jgi:lambda family phage portal protein